jgi:hypothetical protein
LAAVNTKLGKLGQERNGSPCPAANDELFTGLTTRVVN